MLPFGESGHLWPITYPYMHLKRITNLQFFFEKKSNIGSDPQSLSG